MSEHRQNLVMLLASILIACIACFSAGVGWGQRHPHPVAPTTTIRVDCDNRADQYLCDDEGA